MSDKPACGASGVNSPPSNIMARAGGLDPGLIYEPGKKEGVCNFNFF